MTLDGNGNLDAAKTNLYREELGQAPVSHQNVNDDWSETSKKREMAGAV